MNDMYQKCYWCNKEFFIPSRSEYAYKKHLYHNRVYSTTIFFCSWKHLREYEKMQEEVKQKRKEEADRRLKCKKKRSI